MIGKGGGSREWLPGIHVQQSAPPAPPPSFMQNHSQIALRPDGRVIKAKRKPFATLINSFRGCASWCAPGVGARFGLRKTCPPPRMKSAKKWCAFWQSVCVTGFRKPPSRSLGCTNVATFTEHRAGRLLCWSFRFSYFWWHLGGGFRGMIPLKFALFLRVGWTTEQLCEKKNKFDRDFSFSYYFKKVMLYWKTLFFGNLATSFTPNYWITQRNGDIWIENRSKK